MNVADLLVVSLLGGILGLDVVSFPQAMLSRPLVGCTLAAGLMGRPDLGLMLGVLVECFALETLPVGASRYPEWGSSSVVGGTLVARATDEPAATLALAVIATLSIAWLGGWSMVQLRVMNARWARARHEAVARGSHRVVGGLQLYGLTADLARGSLVTAAGLVVFQPVAAFAQGHWMPFTVPTRVVLVTIAGAAAAGAVYKVFHTTSHTRWYFLGGLMAGAALLVSR